MIKAKLISFREWARLKRCYSVPNAAILAGVDKAALYKQVERGKIENEVIGSLNGKGGSIMIPQSEVTRIRKKGNK